MLWNEHWKSLWKAKKGKKAPTPIVFWWRKQAINFSNAALFIVVNFVSQSLENIKENYENRFLQENSQWPTYLSRLTMHRENDLQVQMQSTQSLR